MTDSDDGQLVIDIYSTDESEEPITPNELCDTNLIESTTNDNNGIEEASKADTPTNDVESAAEIEKSCSSSHKYLSNGDKDRRRKSPSTHAHRSSTDREKNEKHEKSSSSHKKKSKTDSEKRSKSSSSHKSSSKSSHRRDSKHRESSSHKEKHHDSSSRRESKHGESSSRKDVSRTSKEPQSHNEQPKSHTVYEPKGSSKGKQHAFALSHAPVFDQKLLNVTAKKHQFYNMRLYLRHNKMLIADMPIIYSKPPSFPDIGLKQILNWPGVSFVISLDHIQVFHELLSNCERDIVIGDNRHINLRTSGNAMEVGLRLNVQSKKMYPTVHKELLKTYFNAMISAASQHDVLPSKMAEIRGSFGKIVDDISHIPHDVIETKVTHSRFLNKQKYMRIFDNDDEPSSGTKKVYLREIINPEALFRIERSTMLTDRSEEWSEPVEEYFDNIFVTRFGADVQNLKEKFKKCLAMKCDSCNETFEGAMSTVTMKEHIKEKHFIDKPWECVKCKKSWTQFELTEMDWKHECAMVQEVTSTSAN